MGDTRARAGRSQRFAQTGKGWLTFGPVRVCSGKKKCGHLLFLLLWVCHDIDITLITAFPWEKTYDRLWKCTVTFCLCQVSDKMTFFLQCNFMSQTMRKLRDGHWLICTFYPWSSTCRRTCWQNCRNKKCWMRGGQLPNEEPKRHLSCYQSSGDYFPQDFPVRMLWMCPCSEVDDK